VLNPKSGGGQGLQRLRSRQIVLWNGGGGDGALGLGWEGAIGTRDEGERSAVFEPRRRKMGKAGAGSGAR
jgi:hypothetical protein